MFCYAASFYLQNLMSQWAKSYALLCCVMICYADLSYEQNAMLSMSKILWYVMLCLWWHELKSKILWFVSKILCSVMNLNVCYYVLDFCQDQLGKRAWKVLLYDDVVCFLEVLDLIFELLALIWATLRSLPWHAFTNSQFDIGNSWNHAPNTNYTLSAICLCC